MYARVWIFVLIFLFILIIPVFAVCNERFATINEYENDLKSCHDYGENCQFYRGIDPSLSVCTDLVGPNLPSERLPSDAEIEDAKREYLSYIKGFLGKDISGSQSWKFHTEPYNSETGWNNRVELEVKFTDNIIDICQLYYNKKTDKFEFSMPDMSSPFSIVRNPPDYTPGFVITTPSEPPEESDIPWAIVIGVGVLGLAAIAGAKLLTGKNSTTQSHESMDENKQKENGQKIKYILQLSTDNLTVSSDKSESLTVTVWRQEDHNPPVKDPGAIVSVSTPRESGLTILPATGSSPLTTDISLTGETKNSPVTLIVSASAGGTTRTADVTVTIEASLQKGFE